MEAQHLASRKSSSLHSDHHHHTQGSFTFVVYVLIFTRESINRATYGFYDHLQAFLGLEVSHISSWNCELLTHMDVKRRNINPKPYHIVVSDSVHWHACCGFGTTYCRHRRQEFLIPIGIVIKVHGILFYFKTPTTPLSGPYKCLSKAGWDALIFKARKIGSGREQGTYIHCWSGFTKTGTSWNKRVGNLWAVDCSSKGKQERVKGCCWHSICESTGTNHFGGSPTSCTFHSPWVPGIYWYVGGVLDWSWRMHLFFTISAFLMQISYVPGLGLRVWGLGWWFQQ